ncbi:hypothetical protein NITMOv2_1276 [Nitrospira moscoviensis]|uniref:Uncharacterized protein n=1 Tax=Nitrospira moscoviensis TaxID=42253 RepID=A0A0K2GA02_NITMO|nr:hypothetical protein NITMOv2_1276 [Nitrospira moscoviensis]
MPPCDVPQGYVSVVPLPAALLKGCLSISGQDTDKRGTACGLAEEGRVSARRGGRVRKTAF